MNAELKFYTYAYLNENNVPYYIGKGHGERAYTKHNNVTRPLKDKILILKENLSEKEAIKHEEYMIYVHGKGKENSILENKSNRGYCTSLAGYKQEDADEWTSCMLSALFGSKTTACVLLFLNKEKEAHALRIAKTFGFGLNQTQRQLKKLEANYVLISWKVGNVRLYAFNKRNPTVVNLQVFLSSCK
jgi:hypothetical protein